EGGGSRAPVSERTWIRRGRGTEVRVCSLRVFRYRDGKDAQPAGCRRDASMPSGVWRASVRNSTPPLSRRILSSVKPGRPIRFGLHAASPTAARRVRWARRTLTDHEQKTEALDGPFRS